MSGAERMATLYHGTTNQRAQRIAEAQEFAVGRLFFTLGSNRDLAEYFAQRTVSKAPKEGGAGLVIVTIPEETFNKLRSMGLMKMIGFDADDKPELRRRNQWVLEAAGVPLLNRDIEECEWVRI